MSIFIKGVDMPKDDKEIQLRIDSHGEVYVYNTYPTMIGKAVEIPTPHGRLIDERDVGRFIITNYPIEDRPRLLFPVGAAPDSNRSRGIDNG